AVATAHASSSQLGVSVSPAGLIYGPDDVPYMSPVFSPGAGIEIPLCAASFGFDKIVSAVASSTGGGAILVNGFGRAAASAAARLAPEEKQHRPCWDRAASE